MFGLNANIMRKCPSFCYFNALRKNILIEFYDDIKHLISLDKISDATKYKDYYFMPQFEIGQ